MTTAAAWHEAGHALLVLHLGGAFSRAEVQGEGGHVQDVTVPTPRHLLSVYTGGKIAEALALGQPDPRPFSSLSLADLDAGRMGGDGRKLARLAATLPGGYSLPVVTILVAEQEAERVLRSRWADLQALALALDRHGTLSFDAARRVVG